MTTGVYQTIANRFSDLHTIYIADHIQKILKVGYTVGEGFSFTPKDHRHLISALKRTKKFHPDDRRDFFGAAAASQTEGDGWREEGLTSLHCAIAPAVCSVHIDSIVFVLSGPSGASGPGGKYSPDLFQHILHDLGWWKVVTAAYGKSSLLGDVLSRVHPHVFNSADKYRKVGIGVAPLDVKDS